MSWTGKNRRGKTVTLLTPSEKTKKFFEEKRDNVRRTNDGQIKENKPLTKEGRAYRDGYLAAQRDNANAFISKHPRYQHKTEAGKKRAEKRKAWKSKEN